MTLVAPVYLAAAAALAGLVVLLHFIATREPATVPLPTARFAPNRPVRARARAFKPTDLPLLLCRIGLILCAGAALAQPVPEPSRRPSARIVALDRSGSIASVAEAADSARSLLSADDGLVVFDSAARRVPFDALSALTRSDARGSLSAALIAAIRTAVSLRDQADSLELVIVSALTADEVDQATDSIRDMWPGAIRLVRIEARRDSAIPAGAAFEGAAADPLRWALPSVQGTAEASGRIVRGAVSFGDSAWAAGSNHTLVLWSADRPRAVRDSAGAVSVGDIVVVAPFERSDPSRPPAGARIVARWVDGTPAAFETAHGGGCIRTVLIPVPLLGDLVLDPRFRKLAAALTAACGQWPAVPPLDSRPVARLAGTGEPSRVAVESLPRPGTVRSPLTPWLLAAALGLGLGELLLRRRRGGVAEA